MSHDAPATPHGQPGRTGPGKRPGPAGRDGRSSPGRRADRSGGEPRDGSAAAAIEAAHGRTARMGRPGQGEPWRRTGRLFPEPPPEAARLLLEYEALLERALPLKPAHARELPRNIAALSRDLTTERSGAPRPGYMSDPRVRAAYAWYFLPWNLYRLSRLLPALPLDPPDGARLADVGSGPLTFVQALWMSRPELRQRELFFTCVDRSKNVLDLGLTLFSGLAGYDPRGDDGPWRVRAVRGDLVESLPQGLDLVTAVNVLNELAPGRPSELAERMERMALALIGSLSGTGRILVVEPGTRFGGRVLAALRSSLVEAGAGLLAPCPHDAECPLRGGRARGWCHFTCDAAGAPAWLLNLSRRAGLPKESLAACLLYAGLADMDYPSDRGRVVSNAFRIPGRESLTARYACSDGGLRLLLSPGPSGLRPGDQLSLAWPESPPRDAKSGAGEVLLAGSHGPPGPPGPRGPAGPARNQDRPDDRAGRVKPGRAAPRRPAGGPRPARPKGRAGKSPPTGTARNHNVAGGDRDGDPRRKERRRDDDQAD